MGGALKKGGYGYECGKTFCRKTARACVRLRLEARRNKRALRRRSSRLRCWLSPRCTSLPCTRSLVKLADFFGCSLLYLLGLEEENSLTRPRANLPDFSKRLLFLKERHEIKIYMLKRTGRLGAASSFYNWTKRGSLPDVYNLLALSDVFRCTPDFLLGRED